ncbi:MAG: hypothetical protein L0Z50_00980 [Verrucomicrobiales bacterium]|nr:hypothetical protein [Verrucomicrobiales bacterium]
MATPALSEIESEFARLSPEAQLALVERLMHRARVATAGHRDAWEADLAAMAADPPDSTRTQPPQRRIQRH